MDGRYTDCECDGEWTEPAWDERITYRLHPHNDLIQAHKNGAKIQAYVCGDWVEEPYPDWYEDTQYRVKPDTKTVHEWMFKGDDGWGVISALMSEREAEKCFAGHEYRKTGRAWEVEI
jgi:hypothetical protein